MKITRSQLRKIILEAAATYRSPMQRALDKERQLQRDRLNDDDESAYQRGFMYGSKFFREPYVDFSTGHVNYDAINAALPVSVLEKLTQEGELPQEGPFFKGF